MEEKTFYIFLGELERLIVDHGDHLCLDLYKEYYYGYYYESGFDELSNNNDPCADFFYAKGNYICINRSCASTMVFDSSYAEKYLQGLKEYWRESFIVDAHLTAAAKIQPELKYYDYEVEDVLKNMNLGGY